MQNNTNSWPHNAHPSPALMNPNYQNEQVTTSSSRTRPSSSWFLSSSRSSSQPPSPRRARSSIPSPPTLLTTRQNDEEYFLYLETHNRIISQMHERANGIPNPDINNIGIATGEESIRQYLILKALDAFSAEEITRIGIFLSRNRLVSLWLQNLLEDVEEKGKREGKVFGYRWGDIVRELVVGNRIVRGLLTGLLLREVVDERWEIREILDGGILERVESYGDEMRGIGY